MASPFPGMDPYIEQFWNDVHGTLIPLIKEELNSVLPPQYRATLNTRIILDESESPPSKARYPYVAVVDWPIGRTEEGRSVALHSRPYVAEVPELIRFEPDPITE